MMEHILDNPAYNALISGNKQLAQGNEQIKYFDKQVAPFVGFKEPSTANFQLLYEVIPHSGPGVFISPVETEVPAPWQVMDLVKGFQLIYEGGPTPINTAINLIELTGHHIPQMLELTALTNPGPFSLRTIDFGHYSGIFDGDKLVAMTGQRMNPLPYAEISAVCTHPDYTGKGYAKLLLQYHINRIIAAGETPFLHVRQDNERAIKIYKSMGFTSRHDIYFYVIKK